MTRRRLIHNSVVPVKSFGSIGSGIEIICALGAVGDGEAALHKGEMDEGDKSLRPGDFRENSNILHIYLNLERNKVYKND